MRLSPSRTAEFVEEYSKDQQSVLVRAGRRYRVVPENEAELEVESEGVASAAPLEQVQTTGSVVVFPDGRQVHTAEVDSARVVVHGEDLARLEAKGDQAARKLPMLGVQMGGTGFLQAMVRMRVIGPLYFELGGFLLPIGPQLMVNGSTGLVLEVPIAGDLSTYAGAGGGLGFFMGEGVSGCPAVEPGPGELSTEPADCTAVGMAVLYFGHARLGVGYRIIERHLWIGVDGGLWYGQYVELSGDEPAERDRVLWPMGGFALFHQF